jgi:tRNA U34 5-carboxymethylaminomethyl modifying enzyme MnmG/GidA
MEVESKYAGFIERKSGSRVVVRGTTKGGYRLRSTPGYPGLSNEAVEKLSRAAPATLGNACRRHIAFDAMLLLAFLKKAGAGP